jgi:hypothetical protein
MVLAQHRVPVDRAQIARPDLQFGFTQHEKRLDNVGIRKTASRSWMRIRASPDSVRLRLERTKEWDVRLLSPQVRGIPLRPTHTHVSPFPGPEHYRPTLHNPTDRASNHLHKVALPLRGLMPHLLTLTLKTIVYSPLSFPSLLIAIPGAEIARDKIHRGFLNHSNEASHRSDCPLF